MASFSIEPENRFFLASLSSHPLVQQLEIECIGVDPQRRAWTFVLKGAPQGDPALWDELRQAVRNLHPEVAHVSFEWTDAAKEPNESEQAYLENAIKQVNGGPINYGTAATGSSNGNGNGNGSGGRMNGRRRSLLRKSIPGEPIPIVELQEADENVIICGEVVAFESRLTRTGKTLIMFDVYDGTDTLGCKAFLDEPEEVSVKKGQWVKVVGRLQFQTYDNELSLMAQGLAFAEAPPASPIMQRSNGWNYTCIPK